MLFQVELYKIGGGTAETKLDVIGQKFLQINQSVMMEIPNMYDSSALLGIIII